MPHFFQLFFSLGIKYMNIKALTLTILLVSIHASAANISPTDTATLINAISSANCGDIITITDGDYRNVAFNARQRCAGSAPLKITAMDPGQVSFIEKTRITLSGSGIQLSGINFENGTRKGRADLITVTGKNNRITNSKFIDIDLAEGVWIKLNGRNNRVDHNSFTGKRSAASYINIDVSPTIASEHRIDHNYFSRPPLGKNGGSASRVGHGSMHDYNARVIFEYNLFEQENGESEIISAKSSENIFRYNTFKNSEGHLSLRQGKRSLVYDNYFLGTGKAKQGGLFIRGEDHVIFNNYFANLAPHPKKPDFGTVSFGSASAKADLKRQARGLNPYHFPLTRNILFANNTLVNSANIGVSIGAQYALNDRRNRTRLPESLYLINNVISKAPMVAKQQPLAKDINWLNNFYDQGETNIKGLIPFVMNSSSNTAGIELPRIKNSTPANLAPWVEKLGLDMSWSENASLVYRIKANTGVGFSMPHDKQGKPVLPLTKQQVGTSW